MTAPSTAAVNPQRHMWLKRVAAVAVLPMLLLVFGLMQGTRRAHGRFDGELDWQRAHADAVAAWALSSAGDRSHSGSGDLFDHEWTLVSCQMAVLGLAQMVRQHPETRDDYLPAMRCCSEWLVSDSARQFGTAKWGEDFLGSAAPGGSHAYMGYAALALSMHRRVEPEPAWAAEHDRIIGRLEGALDRPPHRVETYPGEAYPADIAAVIGAVALAGRDVSSAVERYRMAAVDPETGLLYQSLRTDGSGPADGPRGSGTAIAAYFLGFADRTLSRNVYEALELSSFLGIRGIREYPTGIDGWGDVDSGPVLFGLGVSASGFALAGARMHDDRDTFVRIHRTAGVFGLPGPSRQGRWYWAGGSIGNSILLAMMTAEKGPAEP